MHEYAPTHPPRADLPSSVPTATTPARQAKPRLAPFRHLHEHEATTYERWVKPVFDRLVAALLLLLAAPILLGLTAAVLMALGRPVFLRQARVGKDGQIFGMLKFRTMLPDRRAGRRGSYDGPERRRTHKSAHDPRLVPLGRLMRALSLDELPQLLNVLRGEMSLVGPRPELQHIVAEHYEPWHHARHQVKPGLTGLWQVTERAHQPLMHQCVATDLRYVRRISFREDLKILVQTIPALLGLKRGI
jgi:lipopolysaccharide/colanic/teichoic acid biosynthesis glycosyltransferase